MTVLLQSLLILLGCCSFRGVLIGSLQSPRSGDPADNDGTPRGLDGLLASDVIELILEAELLRDTEFKLIVFVTGLPAFSMLSIKLLTLCLLFWRLRVTLGLRLKSSTWKLVGRIGKGSLVAAKNKPSQRQTKAALLLKHMARRGQLNKHRTSIRTRRYKIYCFITTSTSTIKGLRYDFAPSNIALKSLTLADFSSFFSLKESPFFRSYVMLKRVFLTWPANSR